MVLIYQQRESSIYASLSDISIDGTSSDGFNASIYTYNVELTSTDVPKVIATTTDDNASAEVIGEIGLQ